MHVQTEDRQSQTFLPFADHFWITQWERKKLGSMGVGRVGRKAIERNGGSVSVILMGWWWQLQSSFTTCTNTDGESFWKFRVDKSSAKVRLRLDDGGCWKSSEKLIKVHADLRTSRGRRMLQEILGFYSREHVNAKKRNGLGTLRTTPIYDTQFWRTKKKRKTAFSWLRSVFVTVHLNCHQTHLRPNRSTVITFPVLPDSNKLKWNNSVN